jgi:hypothetical protein
MSDKREQKIAAWYHVLDYIQRIGVVPTAQHPFNNFVVVRELLDLGGYTKHEIDKFFRAVVECQTLQKKGQIHE